MPKFDDQYYFILSIQDERVPFMTPDEDTTSRQFGFKKIPIGSKPLVFLNGAYDIQKRKRLEPINPPPDFLFCGSDVLIKDEVREKLLRYEIPNLAIQPAIYIDHKNVWHEDRWYLTFLNFFDCWDRHNSTHGDVTIDFDENNKLYDVYTYSLNEKILEETPLEYRRLFKMGGTSEGMVVAHMSVASLFHGSGAVVIPIAEYGVSFP